MACEGSCAPRSARANRPREIQRSAKEREEIKMKLFKKLLCTVLAVAMLLSVAAVAFAVEVPEAVTFYRSSTYADDSSFGFFSLYGMNSDTKIGKITSSKKAVATVYGVERYSGYWEGYEYDDTSSWDDATVQLRLLKAGTTNITSKIDGNSYKTKVTVKKYTNPVKSFVITGIGSKNLKSAFAKRSYNDAPLTKAAKKGNIKLKAASGWKIESIAWRNDSTGQSYHFSSYEKPVSSVTLPIPAMKTTINYSIEFTMINTKTDASIGFDYWISNVAGE